MRTVSPANTRATSACGRGGAFVSASDSCTRTVSVAAVSYPVPSRTTNVARTVIGVLGAWYRRTSPATNSRPCPSPSGSANSVASEISSPSGSYASSSTGTVTTPPVRTSATAFGTTGGCVVDDAGTGVTTICPVALAVPFETTYCSVTGSVSTPTAEICTSSRCRTATRSPSGASTESSSSTLPAGSLSFASGATVVWPPCGSVAVSRTATGGSGCSGRARTSMRATPVACCGAAVTVNET